MSGDRTPTTSIAPFGLRLQPELKARVEEAARASGRSLNSEIAIRLADSLAGSSAEPSKADPEVSAVYGYLDAFDPDVVVRARVIPRLQLAAAEKANAVDLVLITRDVAERIEATGAKIHDGAKAAIEAAFPADPVTAGEILDVLKSGTKVDTSALIARLERQVGAGSGRAS